MAFTLRDLPAYERPRERLKELGAHSLSALELIEIILGQGSVNNSVLVTSQQLISKFGSIGQLYSASINQICEVKGIGHAKAAQIKAALELGKRLFLENANAELGSILTSVQAFQLSKYYLKNKKKEYLLLFCMNVHGKLITRPKTISVGILDCSLIHPREIFDCAIRYHSSKIMLAHNHPSGSSQPSVQDIEVTNQIYSASSVVGIPLIDHIIVGNNEFSSIRELKPELFS